MRCLCGYVYKGQAHTELEHRLEHNSDRILFTKRGDYKEMSGVKATQIYVRGPVGQHTYICVVLRPEKYVFVRFCNIIVPPKLGAAVGHYHIHHQHYY